MAKLYLIRHAHSLENQRINSMFKVFGDMGRFSCPRKADVGESLELLKLDHDPPLSEKGLKQCETMKKLLKEKNFVADQKIELVVHSPLERARQTCQELIGCSSETPVDESTASSPRHSFSSAKFRTSSTALANGANGGEVPSLPGQVQRVVSLSLLEEKMQLEWLPGNSSAFEKRVVDFRQWLVDQPESVICVVGHSQYFKRMLQMPFKFDNTDVYRIQFDPQKKTRNEPIILEHDGTADQVVLEPEWYGLELLHTCNRNEPENTITDTHPVDAKDDKGML